MDRYREGSGRLRRHWPHWIAIPEILARVIINAASWGVARKEDACMLADRQTDRQTGSTRDVCARAEGLFLWELELGRKAG